MGAKDESKILGHFSDVLDKMTQSIVDLDDGYFMALWEVIHETEKALQDISRIDSHYVSHVVTVMASWQEAVQVAMTHMENVDTTIYLAHHEDVRRATKEYVAEVIKAHEECNDVMPPMLRRRSLGNRLSETVTPKTWYIHLLEATCWMACAQAERAVDAFINKIKETLQKHVPISTQGQLIANTLSTTFQFQMSIWQMIGDECICPLRAKHSNWCGLAGIIQAIVEMFPNNCAIMFPPAPAPEVTFSSTFQPDEDEDDDSNSFGHGSGLCRFNQDSSVPSGSGCGTVGGALPFSSTPLPHGGCFIIASEWTGAPSSTLSVPPPNDNELAPWPYNEELEMGMQADDEGDGGKCELGCQRA